MPLSASKQSARSKPAGPATGLLLPATICALVIVLICLIYPPPAKTKPQPVVPGFVVVRAVQEYCAAHPDHAETVTFTQLITEGFLSTNALKDYGAAEVTVFLNATTPSPQTVLMDARMPDGSHAALLGDGSVQPRK